MLIVYSGQGLLVLYQAQSKGGKTMSLYERIVQQFQYVWGLILHIRRYLSKEPMSNNHTPELNDTLNVEVFILLN